MPQTCLGITRIQTRLGHWALERNQVGIVLFHPDWGWYLQELVGNVVRSRIRRVSQLNKREYRRSGYNGPAEIID